MVKRLGFIPSHGAPSGVTRDYSSWPHWAQWHDFPPQALQGGNSLPLAVVLGPSRLSASLTLPMNLFP